MWGKDVCKKVYAFCKQFETSVIHTSNIHAKQDSPSVVYYRNFFFSPPGHIATLFSTLLHFTNYS